MIQVRLRLSGRPQRALPLLARPDPALPRQALRSTARSYRPAPDGRSRGDGAERTTGGQRNHRRGRCQGCRGAAHPATAPRLRQCLPRPHRPAQSLPAATGGPAMAGTGLRAPRTVVARGASDPESRANAGGSAASDLDRSCAPGRSPAVPTRKPGRLIRVLACGKHLERPKRLAANRPFTRSQPG